ncbi:LLM class flavin-dependent oxidoreductase [Bradyrhizobium brasilense]|uniref:LLM class flavin-dependent oxidoreductase n=1 Tax=Bradyrhizobium brasilense TaxID=1419277 RepID=A0ABY8JAJ6_9BRAD|nr:LLM class flavin-dependent oxidoreductase [Bradyrhizobium brasilense]WFU62589.1 LLM class flavin-dependent oxidoreductase [Bradyrhizobium brasilense]
MAVKRQMALGAVIIHPHGTHTASWLMPEAEKNAANDIGYYKRIAQLCERGKFDLFFITDTPAARTDHLLASCRWPNFMNVFDPITLLAAISGATRRIGLAATVSTSFSEPYTLARQFATLDHISGGRAGWNVVTSTTDHAARNYGLDRLPPHGDRYERAREFVDVVKALWDTWEDDAFVYDKENALSFLPEKFHVLDHKGKYLKVFGGLNLARSPQGRPVIFQAGASEAGKELGAETADVVFGGGSNIQSSQTFYRDLKGRMGKYRRNPAELKILAGVSIVVGDSKSDAERIWASCEEKIHPDVAVLKLGEDLGTDLSDLPLDEPIPRDRVPTTSNFQTAFFEAIVERIDQGGSLRDIAMQYNRRKPTVCGSADDVANYMEQWVAEEACDGFLISFPVLPGTLFRFVEQVVPELQRRGLFKTEYTGETLRENLGLQRPANRHVVAKG